MKNFFDLKKEYLSETRYDVSWGVGVETQVIAKDPNEARKKAKEMILKRIPKLSDPKYSDVWEKNPRIHKISENTDIDETLEEVEIDEAVEVRHDRYMRSHGRKARDGYGMWMFTHKDRGDVDYKDEKQVHTVTGNFGDAKKSAQQWGKKHGHSAVYVMEEVELDEAAPKMKSDFIKIQREKDKAHADATGRHVKSGRKKTITSTQRSLASMRNEEVELDEVSDKMLDRYRQKAFTDQPSGDDGSDKYRKRKFGRDLAFAKQTGRAKVLATKESVDLDEAVNTKKIAADYDAGHSMDVIVQKHLNKKGDNKDEILKAVRDHRWKTRMKKEEVELDEVSSELAHSTYKKRMDQASAALKRDDYAGMRKAEKKAGETHSRMIKKILRREEVENDTSINLHEDPWEEIPMMKRQLNYIIYAAEEIAEYLDLGADPEEWYQNKLAEVFSKMQDLHAYMEGDEEDEDDDDDDDMEEMRDPAHPYLHGGKHSKNLSTMGWPTKDVKIHQGFGKHYINVHQYKESLDEMEGSAKRNRELYATGRISKDEFDRRMGYGKYKNFKDAPNKRLDGPGGIYKNLVKRFGEETEIEEKLKVSDGVGSWIDDFQKSDAPQFKGKSKKDRRNMALAAYLSAKKKNESKEE